MEAGLPDGAVRAHPVRFDAERVRAATLEVAESPPKATPLLAWLSAWRHHWPEHFEKTLGPTGHATIERLRASLGDPNRYLKLRRIAIANLAKVL